MIGLLKPLGKTSNFRNSGFEFLLGNVDCRWHQPTTLSFFHLSKKFAVTVINEKWTWQFLQIVN